MKDRRERVLCATIESYIKTNEPVGSKALANAHPFDCSSATLRHELHELEESGFLAHLHTSSGRVPTTKGYRYYVDHLAAKEYATPIPNESLVAIDQSLTEVMEMVVKLVRNMFDYSVVVLQPHIFRDALDMIRFVVQGVNRVLVVLACNSGLTEEFFLNVDHQLEQSDCDILTELLNRELSGCSIPKMEDMCTDMIVAIPKFKALLRGLNCQLNRIMQKHSTHQPLLTGGIANMLSLPEFLDVRLVQNVVSVMEENTALARFLVRQLNQPEYSVVIGDEHEVTKLQDCSMVMSSFRQGDTPVGVLGVLGPKRMCYEKVIPMVNDLSGAISSSLSKKKDTI